MRHVDIDRLLDESLDSEALREIQAHIEQCERCRRRIGRASGVHLEHTWERIHSKIAPSLATQVERREQPLLRAVLTAVLLAVPIVAAGLYSLAANSPPGSPDVEDQPSPSLTVAGSCVFDNTSDPHVWIRDFVAAYNDRDVHRIDELAPEMNVRDVLGATMLGAEAFGTAAEWVAALWRLEDRIEIVGFRGLFATTVTRSGFEEVGALEVVMDLEITTDGCQATSLVTSFPLAIGTDPCAIYLAFPRWAENASGEPGLCHAEMDVRFARTGHVAIGLGEGVLVLGGAVREELGPRTDGVFIDEEDIVEIPSLPSGGVIAGAVAISGDQALVWSVQPGELHLYDHANLSWTHLVELPKSITTIGPGVWTGSELVITPFQLAADGRLRGWKYSLEDGDWSELPESPLAARRDFTLVWSGDELLIWGGENGTQYSDGAAYDPSGNTWRIMADSPLDSRVWHSAVWTGSEMIVWGGANLRTETDSGAIYDPVADRWTPMPAAPISARYLHAGVWTGTDVFVWGGTSARSEVSDGALFSPSSNMWRILEQSPLTARCGATASILGLSVVVVGGNACESGAVSVGGAALYNLSSRAWTNLSAR